jgi:mRNA interferase MazF
VFRLRAPRGVRGHELAGPRFGVVIQASELAALSTVVVAPTSTGVRPSPFRPEVVIAGNQTRVAVEQLTAVDRTRLGESHGLLKWEEMREVDTALVLVLGLAP